MFAGWQAVPADSVRRAVTDVFARPEFRWEPPRHTLQWLEDGWRRFVAWVNGFGDRHPLLGDLSNDFDFSQVPARYAPPRYRP